MRDVENVEEILARLMPAALREASHVEIGETLDDLAMRDFPQVANEFPPRRKWMIGGGIAALLAVVFSLFSKPGGQEKTRVVQAAELGEMVLLEASARVEEMTDEGWREQEDGSAIHAVRVNVVDEKQIRDGETGIVMRISQPREEWILTPINSF